MRLPKTAPEHDPTLPGVEELSRQIHDLEQRVSILEQRLAASGAPAGDSAIPASAASELVIPAAEWTAGIAVLAGKALLGIAGAYLLRALTESGVLSRTMGIRAGLIYSVVWLYLASRARSEQKTAVTFHALTSALILGPLLWEAIVRFQIIATWSGAVVLMAYPAAGLTLSWRNRNTTAARISLAASSLIAAMLLLATHDLVPFTLALLATAALVEFSVSRDHAFPERWLVTGLAALAVLLFTYLVSRPEGLPEGYVRLPSHAALLIQALLVTIYTASTLSRTFLQRRPFTLFDTLQSIAVFLIGVGGALRVSGQDPAALPIVAFWCVTAGIACYAISFAILSREGDRNRNFYLYATFAMLLLIAGSRLILNGFALSVALLGTALLCCSAGLRASQHILQLHGSIYLLLPLFSGWGGQSFAQFFTTDPISYATGPAALFIAAALLCYVAILRNKISRWDQWVSALVTSAAFTWVAAGALASLVISFWPGGAILLRTAVLTSLAIGLAWAGMRRQRAELIWQMYPIMIITAYKIVTQDFRQERTLPLVISLLLYGGAMMLLPRILRTRSFNSIRKDRFPKL